MWTIEQHTNQATAAYCLTGAACEEIRRAEDLERRTYKVKGKTVNVKLSPQAAPRYQAATKQHRQLKAALSKMERLSRTALAQLAKQSANAS
jgi:hypothetical protein